MLHVSLHFLVPALVAWLHDPGHWRRAWLVMAATLLVDLDHLLAVPVYDPGRCSIGFHPLHGWFAITAYYLLCLYPKSRLLGLGLLIHMFLDTGDCLRLSG